MSPRSSNERTAWEAIEESAHTAHQKRIQKNPTFFTDQAKVAFASFPDLKDWITQLLSSSNQNLAMIVSPYKDKTFQKYQSFTVTRMSAVFCEDPINNLCCFILHAIHKEYNAWDGATGFLLEIQGTENTFNMKPQQGSPLYSTDFDNNAYDNALSARYHILSTTPAPLTKSKSLLSIHQTWVNTSLRETPIAITCIALSVVGCLATLIAASKITDTNTLMIALFAASAVLLIVGITLAERACHANKKLTQRNWNWQSHLNKKKQLTQPLPNQDV